MARIAAERAAQIQSTRNQLRMALDVGNMPLSID
jgi:hypothetical protein